MQRQEVPLFFLQSSGEQSMTIQDAVKACLAKKNQFGRPVSWKNTGEGIDLARHLDKAQSRKMVSLNSPHNLLGTDWNPHPKEFLGDWEVVTAEEMADEVCQMEKLNV